ncbi:MAG: bacillithiol biosynthesis BshC, partial [Alphaproteobacteria bacterium]|nr:bacillithiol biosynthesis BshC [Alphaproteobacteria bacterium]
MLLLSLASSFVMSFSGSPLKTMENPNIDSFADAIKNKSFSQDKRNLLSEVLLEQYKNSELELSKLSISQIESLKNENTYTVTTGHQLSIFTGPLYFIYKIVTAIVHKESEHRDDDRITRIFKNEIESEQPL